MVGVRRHSLNPLKDSLKEVLLHVTVHACTDCTFFWPTWTEKLPNQCFPMVDIRRIPINRARDCSTIAHLVKFSFFLKKNIFCWVRDVRCNPYPTREGYFDQEKNVWTTNPILGVLMSD